MDNTFHYLTISYSTFIKNLTNSCLIEDKNGGDFMGLIITLILAGIIGWIASIIMKVDGQMGWIANIIVGIIGGYLGTLLFGFIVPASPTDNGFSLSGIIVGIIGACLAIYIWKLLSGRRSAI
jgi:uncharacterized membrane protein YeaQ/YmgE (transglycosylase-associated protein family)